MGTTQAKVSPDDLKQKKIEFLQKVVDIVTMEEIPSELILTGIRLGLTWCQYLTGLWSRKESNEFQSKGLKIKGGVFCGSLIGEFLPIQLIYGGKTKRCHPPQSFPSDWHVTQNQKHWSNEDTMLQYIKEIIIPFVIRVHDDLERSRQH